MSDELWCGKMPNTHLLWETIHFDQRRCRQLTVDEHEVLFGKRLTWKSLYRKGYRLVRVNIVERKS